MTIAVIEIINQNALYKGYVSLCSHWVYSITTRIKTYSRTFTRNCYSAHWVYSITTRIKTLLQIVFDFRLCSSHWVYSITTRIKTLSLLPKLKYTMSHWVYSITTRIKTHQLADIENPEALIEYIPLQQGLRHTVACTCPICHFSLSIFHYNKD